MRITEIPIVLEIKKKIAEINDKVELKWERALGISRLGNKQPRAYAHGLVIVQAPLAQNPLFLDSQCIV